MLHHLQEPLIKVIGLNMNEGEKRLFATPSADFHKVKNFFNDIEFPRELTTKERRYII